MNQLTRSLALASVTFLLLSPLPLYAVDQINTGMTGSTLSPEGVSEGKPPLGQSEQNSPRPSSLRGMVSGSTGKNLDGEPMKGGRMMASDTRVLPPSMDKVIQKRDEEGVRVGSTTLKDTLNRGGVMASGTQRDCINDLGGKTDCLPNRSAPHEGTKSEMGEHRGDIFLHACDMILKRMHAATDRFNKLTNRIDSRIKKMQVAGRYTLEAEAKLSVARIKITAAEKAVADAKIIVDSVALALKQGTSTLPSAEEKKPAKDGLEKARAAIQSAANALSEVMPSLVGEQSDLRSRVSTSSSSGTSTKELGEMLGTKAKLMPTTTTEAETR